MNVLMNKNKWTTGKGAYFGRKDIANQLLEIAEVYVKACEEKFHMHLFAKGCFLVILAKDYLK